MKFILCYPEQTIELFLSDAKVRDQQRNRLLKVVNVSLSYLICFFSPSRTSLMDLPILRISASSCISVSLSNINFGKVAVCITGLVNRKCVCNWIQSY